MALWLASLGWRVTALDFSAVGLARGQARAEERTLSIDWRVEDATSGEPLSSSYDLVLVLYLQLPRAALTAALQRAADAVAAGGRLLVLGHDRDNLVRGTGGPPDPDVLYDVDLLGSIAAGLQVDRLEQVNRSVGDRTAVDTLLLAHRATARPRPSADPVSAGSGDAAPRTGRA